jgi:hypothetical protein
MKRTLACLLIFLEAASIEAADLTPIVQQSDLGLIIQGAAYPATLSRDLTSGLTNRFLVRVSLANGAEVLHRRAVEIAVRYDLWDEHFTTVVSMDGVAEDARVMRNLDEVMAFLAQLRFSKLFSTDRLGHAQTFTLSADMLLNPIDRERMEMIRKWVAQNSIGPSDPTGRTASADLTVAIFNKIFEQYTTGADVAATWRETSMSAPFKLEELTHESR